MSPSEQHVAVESPTLYRPPGIELDPRPFLGDLAETAAPYHQRHANEPPSRPSPFKSFHIYAGALLFLLTLGIALWAWEAKNEHARRKQWVATVAAAGLPAHVYTMAKGGPWPALLSRLGLTPIVQYGVRVDIRDVQQLETLLALRLPNTRPILVYVYLNLTPRQQLRLDQTMGPDADIIDATSLNPPPVIAIPAGTPSGPGP